MIPAVSKSLIKDQMLKLAEYLKFDNMKKNPACNPTAGLEWHGGDFMRKGEVGDWRHYFNPKMEEQWDAWIEKKVFGTGLEFLMDL